MVNKARLALAGRACSNNNRFQLDRRLGRWSRVEGKENVPEARSKCTDDRRNAERAQNREDTSASDVSPVRCALIVASFLHYASFRWITSQHWITIGLTKLCHTWRMRLGSF